MSRVYELGCDRCKVSIWAGQRAPAAPVRLYSTVAANEQLARFLEAHTDHPLRFIDSDRRPDDWEALPDHPR